jgi:hypothetical protein
MDMTQPPENIGARLVIRRDARFGLKEISQHTEHLSEMFIRSSQQRGPQSAPTPGPVKSGANDRPGEVLKLGCQHYSLRKTESAL